MSMFHALGRTNKYLLPENVCDARAAACIIQSSWKESEVAEVWAQNKEDSVFELHPRLLWQSWSSHVASCVPQFPFCTARLIVSLSISKEDSPVRLWFSLASQAGRKNTLCFSLFGVIFGPLLGGKREMKAPSEMYFLLLEQK